MDEDGVYKDAPSLQAVVHGDVYGTFIQAHHIGEFHIHPRETVTAIPHGLPLAPFRLVNRTDELAVLNGVLAESQARPGPSVAVLTGMHGVGKSALSSHWANLVRTHFTDGDLFADLSRHRRRGGVEVSEVLADFLRSFNLPESTIPPDLATRTSLFRSLTASKRILVYLDDVRHAAEALPLVPSGAGSVVVITSNSYLEELLRAGATQVLVDPLDHEQALSLLSAMVGNRRVIAEPAMTDRLLTICGGLPIALAVCGGLLTARPHKAVSWLVERIDDETERLNGLSRGDESIESVLDFAYVDLSPVAATLYRRLGIYPGPDFTDAIAGVLVAFEQEETQAALDTLVDLHLVEANISGRYRLHDLLRLHSASCSRRDDTTDEVDQAHRRIVDWYHRALWFADRAVTSTRLRLADHVPISSGPTPQFSSAEAALTWFDAELPNVVAVIRLAGDRQWDESVWQMVEAMWPLCFNHKHYAEWIETHLIAVTSTERCGNPAAGARIRIQLARAYIESREFNLAHDQLRMAEVQADLSGHDQLRASVREFVGISYLHEEDYPNALNSLRESRSMFVAIGDRRGIALQDYHIGWTLVLQGNARDAIGPIEDALRELRDLKDETTTCRALLRLGEARLATGELGLALTALVEAIESCKQFGLDYEEAQAREAVAAIADASGHEEDGITQRRIAEYIYRSMGHPRANELAGIIGPGDLTVPPSP